MARSAGLPCSAWADCPLQAEVSRPPDALVRVLANASSSDRDVEQSPASTAKEVPRGVEDHPLLVARCATGRAAGTHRLEWTLREPCSSATAGRMRAFPGLRSTQVSRVGTLEMCISPGAQRVRRGVRGRRRPQRPGRAQDAVGDAVLQVGGTDLARPSRGMAVSCSVNSRGDPGCVMNAGVRARRQCIGFRRPAMSSRSGPGTMRMTLSAR
jgi:hypothetical protein